MTFPKSLILTKTFYPFATTWMNLKEIMLSEISPQKGKIFHNYYHDGVSKIVRLTKAEIKLAENRMVVPRTYVWDSAANSQLNGGIPCEQNPYLVLYFCTSNSITNR